MILNFNLWLVDGGVTFISLLGKRALAMGSYVVSFTIHIYSSNHIWVYEQQFSKQSACLVAKQFIEN
jgi:hypothetical protein